MSRQYVALESLQPAEVEKFLVSLGSLLPSESVRALLDEVKRQHLDGARFDQFIGSKSHPGLGGTVRPSHLAILRRCWLSKHGGGRASRGSQNSSVGTAARGSQFSHGAPSEASAATTVKRSVSETAAKRARTPTKVSEAEEPTERAKSAGVSRSDSKMRFTPPPRSSGHTPVGSSGGIFSATTAAGTSEAGHSSTPSKGKSPSEISKAASIATLSDKLDSVKIVPNRHQSMKTVVEVQGPPSSASSKSAGVRRTRSLSEVNDVDMPLDSKPKKQFRRPSQVPPLDFSFLYKGKDQDAFRRAKEAFVSGQASQNSQSLQKVSSQKLNEKPLVVPSQSEAGMSQSQSQVSGAFVATLPPGFAAATCDDQRRIAAFYGYRHDGFVATMHGLRTDEIRPRLFLGTMADAAYWPLLKALGVTHVLNCAVEAQKTRSPYEPHGIQYMLLPLQDSPETAQLLCKQRFRALREATKFINGCLKSKNQRQAVFVHCVQGLSRSAAIVCAYLMEFEGLSMDRAMTETRTRHKGCLTSHHWQAMLYKFQAELLGQS